jgi:hemoglobin-like flavoprotein
MPVQYRKLLAMLSFVISKLNRLEDVLEEVGLLAKRHVHYGVKPEYFVPVGASLLWTLEQGLGDQWNDEIHEAWTVCYQILSLAMIEAMQSANHQAA